MEHGPRRSETHAVDGVDLGVDVGLVGVYASAELLELGERSPGDAARQPHRLCKAPLARVEKCSARRSYLI